MPSSSANTGTTTARSLKPSRSLQQLVAAITQATEGRLNAQVLGDEHLLIDHVAPLDTAGEGAVSFLSNPRYRAQAQASRATALVLSAADANMLFPQGRTSGAVITTNSAYAWFALAAQQLFPVPQVQAGISAQAVIHPEAHIASSARIDAFVTIDAGARIEEGCWIGAGSHIGPSCVVGRHSRLSAGVRMMDGCEIGARAIVHSGAVIGADGFGFAPLDGRWIKIPQVGRVLIGDDVEIGANTTIDRGTMGDTLIEDGVKIDNQVQIGHNCRIGAHTVIAGCVGIAGSAIIGRGCQIGGAAMIHGHISLCDGTIVSGGTLISRSITQPGFYSGVFPFMANREWERNAAIVRHLDELRSKVRQLQSALPPSDEKDSLS